MKDGKPQSGGEGEKNSNETQSHLEPTRLTSAVSCIFEFALKPFFPSPTTQPPPPQQSGSWELESKQRFAITLHHVWLTASNKQPCPPPHGHKPHTHRHKYSCFGPSRHRWDKYEPIRLSRGPMRQVRNTAGRAR